MKPNNLTFLITAFFFVLTAHASNLTFMVGDSFLEVRLPDGSKGERKLPDDNYRLKRQ